MISDVISLIFLSLLLKLCMMEMETDGSFKNEKNCRIRTRLIASEKGDLYTLVEATLGQKLTLQCHYCNENDDHQSKIWYKIKNPGLSVAQEVKLDLETNLTVNRIHVNPEHTLTIHNFTINDAGLYYCMGIDGQLAENKYNYLVDLTEDTNLTLYEKGNLSDWIKYHAMYMLPLNKLFFESQGDEYIKLREKLKIQMEVITEWDTWGLCEVCGRPQGDGKKKKKGFCRIKINPINKENLTKSILNDADELFLINAFELSCKSGVLIRLFPGISNLTKIIPHFLQEEHCEGTCNPDAEGVNKGWKTGKTLGFKYRKTFVLAENSHLTLVCPEATLENKVIWRKGGKTLEAGESVQPEKPEDEARITVDTFNTLYLTNVKSSEEGNYTCQVDDIRMQQVRIFVVSKAKLLTQAFVRHMMYLSFILSLTLSCYCAGLVVTWKKRNTFKSYEEIKQSKPAKNEDMENLI